MEKKPIKRDNRIVKLSKDHHFALMFCWKIRTGLALQADTDRIKNYVQYFWQSHMKPHFRQEETILFGTVKDSFVQRAIDEHEKIRQQINNLPGQGDELAAQLVTLAEMVDNHVRYEERELFPHLEKLLTNEELESIGKQLAEPLNAAVTDNFPDEFWITKKATPL